jgi:hypothetical protein
VADKTYRLRFELSDGTAQTLDFVVPQGEKGDAYILTESDKREIADSVLEALPKWTGGSY